MTADYRVLLAGQDITSTVQFHSDQNTNLHSRINTTTSAAAGGGGGASPQPILITSTLGQGAGSAAGSSGRSAQATFFTTLGPAATAVGAGAAILTPRLVRQGEVQILDPNGVVLFGGYVGKLSDASIATRVYTQVACYDYWQSLTRININEVLDGISDIAAIRYLLATYAPWIDTSLLPSWSSGTLLGRVWRNKTLQWALKTIADQTGRQIYVTPNKQLLYVSPSQAQLAPFSLSDTPDFHTSFPHAVDSYVVDDTSLINRVTFYGGKKPTPDFTQDISTQANSSNTVFMLAYYPRKSSSGKVQVLVNGQQLNVGYVLSTGAPNTLTSQGGTADCLLDADARTITFANPPATGASVLCIYRYQVPLVVEVTDQTSYAFYGAWYDGTISDETVVDSATAVQRCRVMLLEQSFGQTTLQLRCYQPGLQAGMQLQVTNLVRGIDAVYIIQEVQASPVAVGVFEYAITLGAWNWNLVDVLLRLAQASANQDLAQQENVTPTQVKVSNTINTSLAVVVKQLARPMAQYSPGVTTVVSQTTLRRPPFSLPAITANSTGAMYPGLFTI
jgi:hypothetical protein